MKTFVPLEVFESHSNFVSGMMCSSTKMPRVGITATLWDDGQKTLHCPPNFGPSIPNLYRMAQEASKVFRLNIGRCAAFFPPKLKADFAV